MTWATSHRDDCASSSHVARARSRCADAWSEHAACAPRLRRPGPRYSGALTTPAARALTVVQHLASLEVPASAVRVKDAPSDDSVRVAPTARSAQDAGPHRWSTTIAHAKWPNDERAPFGDARHGSDQTRRTNPSTIRRSLEGAKGNNMLGEPGRITSPPSALKNGRPIGPVSRWGASTRHGDRFLRRRERE